MSCDRRVPLAICLPAFVTHANALLDKPPVAPLGRSVFALFAAFYEGGFVKGVTGGRLGPRRAGGPTRQLRPWRAGDPPLMPDPIPP